MKRYLLFMFYTYYPCGGWEDFQSSFDTIDEALAYQREDYNHFQVVDATTGKIVSQGRNED